MKKDSAREVPDYGEDSRDSLLADECGLFRQLTALHIRELVVFNETLERFIGDELTRFATAGQIHPHESDEWWIEDVVARQFRHAFVSVAMNGTAYHLGQLCQDVALILRRQSPDMNRAPIAEARRFLFAADFAKPRPRLWEEMSDLYALRNVVVHRSGLVREGEKGAQVRQLMRRAPGIAEYSGGIDLKPEFAAFVHERVATFFAELSEEVIALCRRLKVSPTPVRVDDV